LTKLQYKMLHEQYFKIFEPKHWPNLNHYHNMTLSISTLKEKMSNATKEKNDYKSLIIISITIVI
jgi:hypothetical protein